MVWRPAVAIDAVTKLGRYASCGSATKHLTRRCSRYYGVANSEAQDLVTELPQGQYKLASFRSYMASVLHGGRDSSSEGSPDGEQLSCTSHLHCARSGGTQIRKVSHVQILHLLVLVCLRAPKVAQIALSRDHGDSLYY
jgi:hypothetical protein